MSQIVVTCRKLSWRLSHIVVTFFSPSPSCRPLLDFADWLAKKQNTCERKISPNFFRPKLFRGRPRGMSVPKCLFSQDLEGLTEVFVTEKRVKIGHVKTDRAHFLVEQVALQRCTVNFLALNFGRRILGGEFPRRWIFQGASFLEKIGCVFFTCSWGLFAYGSSFLLTVGEP